MCEEPLGLKYLGVTLEKDPDAYISRKPVRCETLASVLDRHGVSRIDLVHVDAEGTITDHPADRLQRFSPRLILYEHGGDAGTSATSRPEGLHAHRLRRRMAVRRGELRSISHVDSRGAWSEKSHAETHPARDHSWHGCRVVANGLGPDNEPRERADDSRTRPTIKFWRHRRPAAISARITKDWPIFGAAGLAHRRLKISEGRNLIADDLWSCWADRRSPHRQQARFVLTTWSQRPRAYASVTKRPHRHSRHVIGTECRADQLAAPHEHGMRRTPYGLSSPGGARADR